MRRRLIELFSYPFKIFDLYKAHRVVFLCAEGKRAQHTACAAFPCIMSFCPMRSQAPHTPRGAFSAQEKSIAYCCFPFAAFPCMVCYAVHRKRAQHTKQGKTPLAAFPCMLCYAVHRKRAQHTKEGKTPLAAFPCMLCYAVHRKKAHNTRREGYSSMLLKSSWSFFNRRLIQLFSYPMHSIAYCSLLLPLYAMLCYAPHRIMKYNRKTKR